MLSIYPKDNKRERRSTQRQKDGRINARSANSRDKSQSSFPHIDLAECSFILSMTLRAVDSRLESMAQASPRLSQPLSRRFASALTQFSLPRYPPPGRSISSLLTSRSLPTAVFHPPPAPSITLLQRPVKVPDRSVNLGGLPPNLALVPVHTCPPSAASPTLVKTSRYVGADATG